MTGTQRRQFEMLLRVRDFGNTHRDVLSTSALAQQLFAAVGTTIDDLTTADRNKMSASAGARADRKAQARRALVELLQKAAQLSRVLRAEGHAVPPCDLPASESNQALLTAGRRLAVDAASFPAEFGGHGMSADLVTEVTAAFERAVAEQGTRRAEHIAARARIQALLQAGVRHVRRLDVIVATELAHDTVARTVWAQAQRLQAVRGPQGSDQAAMPAAATAADAPAPATEAA
jgi:hypothetical protein